MNKYFVIIDCFVSFHSFCITTMGNLPENDEPQEMFGGNHNDDNNNNNNNYNNNDADDINVVDDNADDINVVDDVHPQQVIILPPVIFAEPFIHRVNQQLPYQHNVYYVDPPVLAPYAPDGKIEEID